MGWGALSYVDGHGHGGEAWDDAVGGDRTEVVIPLVEVPQSVLVKGGGAETQVVQDHVSRRVVERFLESKNI